MPTVSVNLFDMNCGDQFRALHDGTLDLGFVGLCDAVEAAGLKHHPVATYKTVAALNKAHPLAGKPVVKLKNLEPMFFIGMSETSYPGYRAWLTTTCRRVGFTPKVLQDAEIERTVLHSVAAGLGVALLPDQVKNLPHEEVVFCPVSPAILTESCMAWRAEKPLRWDENLSRDRAEIQQQHALIGVRSRRRPWLDRSGCGTLPLTGH